MTVTDDPVVVGVANITPDSFYDGGVYNTKDAALKHIDALIQAGAGMIDMGAVSTRPGAAPVDVDTECRRLEPVLSAYHNYFDTPLSVDTTDYKVASMALDYGAAYINDVSGFRISPAMPDLIREKQAGVIIMHSIGTPQTMQDNPVYTDVIQAITQSLQTGIQQAAGIRSLIIDPGIGFGKTQVHNQIIMQSLTTIKKLGHPVMIGVSRKSFIRQLVSQSGREASDAAMLAGSLAGVVTAYYQGVRFFRVHDVAATVAALQVAQATRPVLS